MLARRAGLRERAVLTPRSCAGWGAGGGWLRRSKLGGGVNRLGERDCLLLGLPYRLVVPSGLWLIRRNGGEDE